MSKPRPRSFSAIPSAEQTSKNVITASAKGLLTEQQVNKVHYEYLLVIKLSYIKNFDALPHKNKAYSSTSQHSSKYKREKFRND